MIQLGIRLHDTAEQEIGKRLAQVKADGFSCVHIALAKTAGLPKETEALTPGYAMWLKNVFARAGVDAAVLGNYQNLAHPDEAELRKIKARYAAHLRFASLMGCAMVGTETGAPNAAYAYDKEANHSDRALKILIKNLSDVVRDAERFGVILAIEPVYKHIVYDPKRARQVLDAVASPNLQIIFDPVNLLDPDNLDRRDEVIDSAIELLGPDIAMIHLKDYVMEDGKMKAVGCGLGEMDYTRILKFAKERKPYIHATLENTKPDNAAFCRDHILNIYDNI